MVIRYLSRRYRSYQCFRKAQMTSTWARSDRFVGNGSHHMLTTCRSGDYPARCKSAHHIHSTSVNCASFPGLSLVKRAGKFINDDPLTKVSLIFGGGLLAFLLLLEFLTSLKKKKPVAFATRPPKATHFLLHLKKEVETMAEKIRNMQRARNSPAILYLVGPSGAGKTHLAFQYSEVFTMAAPYMTWLSGKPVVFFVDGSNEELMLLTLKEAAHSLGITTFETKVLGNQEKADSFKLSAADSVTKVSTVKDQAKHFVSIGEALKSKLTSNKVPWLMVVDGLDEECVESLNHLLSTLRPVQKGVVVITTQAPGPFENGETLRVEGLNQKDAAELINRMVGAEEEDKALVQLVKELPSLPLAIALAAATVKIYASSLQQSSFVDPVGTSMTQYLELLKEDACQEHRLDRILLLYLEAADPRVQHGFDFIAACGSPTFPVPVECLRCHFSSPFYSLPPPISAPPISADTLSPDQNQSKPQPSVGKEEGNSSMPKSYLEQFKAMLGIQKQATNPNLSLSLADDALGTLRQSPLLTFQSSGPSSAELMRIQPIVFRHLSTRFMSQTVPRLECSHVVQAEDHFNRTAWLRSYRSFNADRSLEKYRRSLPGVSAVGVATQESFKKNTAGYSASLSHVYFGCKPEKEALTYAEYLHLISHYHRVVESLSGLVRSTTRDLEDTRLKVLLKPLFKQVMQYPLLSDPDRLVCQSSIAFIEASTSDKYASLLKEYECILNEQRHLYGSRSISVAQSLTDMADLMYSLKDYKGAKKILEEALSIHNFLASSSGRNPYFLDFGLTLSSLGIVCSTLGERQPCKNYLEQALNVYQTVPDDGNVGLKQRKLVASTLVDLAHAYLSLGQVNIAKKHIDLAVEAVRSVYGEKHPELARALNVKSVAYALLGDRDESRKLREEAGVALGHSPS